MNEGGNQQTERFGERARSGPRLARLLSAMKLAGSMALLLLLAKPALGQLLDPTDTEELRRRQQREEENRQRQLQAPDVRLQKTEPAADSLELPQESPCFPVSELRLEGEQASRFGWASRYLGNYAGRCVGHEGINLIAKRLTNRFISRGYVTTRVGIPEQDLSTGVLRITLIPGVIRAIRFAEPETRGSWKTAIPSRPGELLDLRELDQGLEQFKRVPSQDVELELIPGDRPGESDVVLKVKRQKPWRGSFTLDNSGSLATGKPQATATFSLDNPLGLNDLLSLSGNHDVAMKEGLRGTIGGSFFYSVPYGYYTFTFSGSASGYHQTVAGQAQEFMYRGANAAASLAVQRVIHRNQVSKSTLQLDLNRRWAQTHLNDEEIRVQRRNVTSAGVSLYHRRALGPATLDATLEYRQGLPWFAQPDPGAESRDSPTTRYHLATFDLSVSVPFQVVGLSVRYLNHTRAQFSWDRLFVSEQFSIGNRYTVRGFDGELTLASEHGWYFRNELGIALGKTGQELYLGVDHGQVRGPAAAEFVGKALTGGVVGIRGAYRFVSYDLFAGFALDKPKGFNTARPAWGVMVTSQF